MKKAYLAYVLLPALALADEATTVPDDEPPLPPLPEELLHPQKGKAGVPATAQPVVSYRAPADDEQTWLKLFYIKPTDAWPDVFRRLADASHARDMQMCHGYALWLRGQDILHLRYDDDLSLSGIHADGHYYGVLYVEFSPYGVRVCPMEGYDLSGKNGGVCWQDAATKLWSWAESEAFWAELPKLLRSGRGKGASSAQDTAVKREVATKGQRMVVFWAAGDYPASSWWPAFARLHAQVGPQRFSLIAPKGLNLWNDVVVPTVKGKTPAPAPAATPATAPTPAPAKPAAATPTAAATTAAAAPAATAPATAGAETVVPATLQPAAGTSKSVAPAASVRPWAMEGNTQPATTTTRKATPAPAAPAEATPPPAETKPAAPSRTLDSLPNIPH